MQELKSLETLQTAKVIGSLYAFLGALVALVFGTILGSRGYPGRGVAVIAFAPILYGLVGFIGSAILCWLYNRIAARIGGIRFELAPPRSS